MQGKLSYWMKAGKITVATGIFALLTLIAVSTAGVVSMQASASGTASSTVRVLNTPPVFTTAPQESVASATTTPTVNGNIVTWQADAKDSSSNNIYLLICTTNAAPTANTAAQPTCAGGAPNTLAVSSAPNSATYPASVMVYATSGPITTASAETVDWYAFVCDDVVGLPKCSKTTDAWIQGTPGAPDASPLVINHPHTFSLLTNDGPKNPGQLITFTASTTELSHQDTINGQDKATLFLCKAADFTGTACGAGGTIATSTTPLQTNPIVSWTFPIPTLDGTTTAYGYVLDSRGTQAIGTAQGAATQFAVNNVAPSVNASTIAFASSTLALVNPLAETGGFSLHYQTVDNNSCTTTAGTAQITGYKVQVYRYAASSTCPATGATYNPNNCYTSEVATTTWNVVCSQDAGSCAGPNSTTANWTCTFPLWSVAEPTDTGTPWTDPVGKWDTRITAYDHGGLSGVNTTDSSTRRADVQQAPYMNVPATTIDFGQFEPGFGNTLVGEGGANLGIQAQGNTALDVLIRTSDMCPNYVATSSTPCTGTESSNTIFGSRQHYATSSLGYGSTTLGVVVGSTSTDQNLDLNVKKPTATSTPTSRNTLWGIFVPGTLTVSGDYKGVNTITALTDPHIAVW